MIKPLEPFEAIYQRAAERKGGSQRLEQLFSPQRSQEALAALPNSAYLAEFTRKVFQCGIVWSVVDKKWPNFERAFLNFNIPALLMQPDEWWESKMSDSSIIRHWVKIATIKHNALMILAEDAQQGFAQMVTKWPSENIVGLWQYLRRHGLRLGGNTGAYALRDLGKDTFILSSDVENYLRRHEIIEGSLHSQRTEKAAQQAFNQWQQESGYSLRHISQTIAFSEGLNRVGLTSSEYS